MVQPAPPDYIDRIELQVHGASALVTAVPPPPNTTPYNDDHIVQGYLSAVTIHRGAHGLRAWDFVGDELNDIYRVFFPVTAPNFMLGAGTLFLESLEFYYGVLGSAMSVPRVVVYDGQSTVETFTEFPHNGGNVNLSLDTRRHSFQKALGVSLILHAPINIPAGITILPAIEVTYLRVQIASSNIASE